MVTFTARNLADRFHKGLILKIESCGQGTWMDDGQIPTWVPWKIDIRRATFALRYVLTDDRSLIRICSSFELLGNGRGWHRFHYAYHYGPDPWDETNTLIRCDRDEINGDHVHLAPTPTDHIKATEVEPSAADIDPLTFIDLIKEYRKTKVPPFIRKER